MVALKAPPIRADIGEKSARTGNLKKGEEFVVLEVAVAPETGATRLRTDRGWINLESKTGDRMVAEVSAPAGFAEPTAAAREPGPEADRVARAAAASERVRTKAEEGEKGVRLSLVHPLFHAKFG
jgi:hypothetical protein